MEKPRGLAENAAPYPCSLLHFCSPLRWRPSGGVVFLASPPLALIRWAPPIHRSQISPSFQILKFPLRIRSTRPVPLSSSRCHDTSRFRKGLFMMASPVSCMLFSCLDDAEGRVGVRVRSVCVDRSCLCCCLGVVCGSDIHSWKCWNLHPCRSLDVDFMGVDETEVTSFFVIVIIFYFSCLLLPWYIPPNPYISCEFRSSRLVGYFTF